MSNASELPPGVRRPRHHKPALIVLVVVAALTCLGLAWWQWERFSAAGGTGRNLGYALQWPLFAGFFVFGYFRFVRLEQGEQTVSPTPRKPPPAREIPAGVLPERPLARHSAEDDPELAEYNNYLAELHARDRARTHSGSSA